MSDPMSGDEALPEFVRALLPSHADAAVVPTLEADAHPAVRALWSSVGESAELAPHGLGRDALGDRVTAIFRRWFESAATRAAWGIDDDDGLPTAKLPAKPRWLAADDYSIEFIDDDSPAADPPVLRAVPNQPEPRAIDRGYLEFMLDRFVARVPVERRASYFFGTPIDEARKPALGQLHPRLHTLARGVWTWQAPPERVLEPLGANVLFTSLGAWVDFVVGLAPEHRAWCFPPQLPALGLERSACGPALPVLDPSHPTPAPNPAHVELTPAFQRVTRGQRLLPQWNRVGRLRGLVVWIFASPEQDDDIHVFHETAEREAVMAELEALGGVIAWMEGRDIVEDPEPGEGS